MKEFLSEEDKNTAFSFIIHNLLITALDRDIYHIEKSQLKMKSQHVLMISSVRDRIIKDTANLKKEMYRNKIKVFDMVNVNEDFISYKYTVRGYESEFRFFKAALKVHTEKLLHSYYFSTDTL
jgi:hypothetical protein